MWILNPTAEYNFVQHVTSILDVPNSRPDLEPGGLWDNGPIRLSWGLRLATEPPTITIHNRALDTSTFTTLPHDIAGRIAAWQAAWRNRQNIPHLANLNFREIVAITAILAWNPPPESSTDDNDHDSDWN